MPALCEGLATRAPTENGIRLNLGDGRAARSIEAAGPALAMRVAKRAGMGAADAVVDAGFGFAEQDMLRAARRGARRVAGLNITPLHLRIGRAGVRRRGLEGVIELPRGPATAMPPPEPCCDVVTAVACACRFDTREAVFAAAWRVLRPGGRLALADILRAAPAGGPPLAGALLGGLRGPFPGAGAAEVLPGWHRALTGAFEAGGSRAFSSQAESLGDSENAPKQ